MATYEIAHIREQGQDIIIIPLDSSFATKPSKEQDATIDSLQNCATSAGLAGTVVPVWKEGNRMRFKAPNAWHPFFRNLSWNSVISNLNKKLTCN